MKKFKEMVNLILRAVGLATGVAVVAMMIMNVIELNTAVMLLGIGVASLGISSFTANSKNGEN